MKWVIASDLHGSAHYTRKLLEVYQKSGAEKLILLGDILYHGPRNDLPDGHGPKQVAAMLNAIADEIICVRGNCDAEVDAYVLDFELSEPYLILEGDGHTFFLTHGHRYAPDYQPPAGTGDIMLFGHTHVPMCEQVGDMLCVNPGSVSIPKGGSAPSCVVYESGEFTFIDLDQD